MFEFDVEKAAKRLIKEIPHTTHGNALQIVRRDFHEKLHSAFMIWLNGGTPQFEYEGFTLEGLKKLRRSESYFHALFDMDRLLKNPEENIPWYSDRRNFGSI